MIGKRRNSFALISLATVVLISGCATESIPPRERPEPPPLSVPPPPPAPPPSADNSGNSNEPYLGSSTVPAEAPGTTTPTSPAVPPAVAQPESTETQPSKGAYYLDDGPGDNPPANLDSLPDAVPRTEPFSRYASRPYTVMGREYTPMTELAPYKARGIASWYGRRFHGKPTSTGEPYDMYSMTAAHTTLPIPSFAKVTSVANGKSVVVRVNDRGPFKEGRIIDLSYAAAHRLGISEGGSGLVDVELIIPKSVRPSASAVAKAKAPQSQTVSASTVKTGNNIFLQLGAFASQTGAVDFANKVRLELEAIGQTLMVTPGSGVFRVHAGPYPTKDAARDAADKIASRMGVKPFVTIR